MTDEAKESHIAGRLAICTYVSVFAEMCHRFYTDDQTARPFSYSDPWTPWNFGAVAQDSSQEVISLEKAIALTPDERVRELCQTLINQSRIVEDINRQLGLALAKMVDLPVPDTGEDNRELRRQVDYYRIHHGPVWARQPEFQPLIAKLQTIASETKPLAREVGEHIARIYARYYDPAEFGDQRAKDLIDEADGEADPERSMRLLRRALRYGHTGVQAAKAYKGLGEHYAEQGNVKKAIEYYTKSISASKHPNSFVLYWRGELYYQQKQWNKARHDFEQALSLGLFSPEYERAHEYLTELRANTA